MTIYCNLCDWRFEFSPGDRASRDHALFCVGRHYERCHAGMMEVMSAFDQRLEEYALLPDPRTEVAR